MVSHTDLKYIFDTFLELKEPYKNSNLIVSLFNLGIITILNKETNDLLIPFVKKNETFFTKILEKLQNIAFYPEEDFAIEKLKTILSYIQVNEEKNHILKNLDLKEEIPKSKNIHKI